MADINRQNSQEKRLSMYLDDYEDEVKNLLRTQFHKDNYDRLYPMYAIYYNLFKKIINLKSVIYKKEANRKIYIGDKEDKKYSEMIQGTNINRIMSTVNKLTNINNTSFVRVAKDNKKICYEAVPSENISIVQDMNNPTKIKALLHRITIKDSALSISNLLNNSIRETNNNLTLKYVFWDSENYAILDADKKILKNYIYPNPYIDVETGQGIIPYTLFSNFESVAGNLWNETLNQDLYIGTLQVNVFQTYLNNLIKTSGYRTPYLTGVSAQEIPKLNNKINDPLQPIVLNDPESKIGTFQLSGNIKEVEDVIHDIISEIADNHGVSFSSRTSSAQKSSGLAMSIEQEAINNIREEQQPLYRASEKELAKKSIIVSNTEFNTSINISGEFAIDFYEDKTEMPVKDKIEWYKFLLSNNLKSYVDIYKDIDPDCTTDKEAEIRIAENKEQNEALKIDDFKFSLDDKTEVDNAEDQTVE